MNDLNEIEAWLIEADAPEVERLAAYADMSGPELFALTKLRRNRDRFFQDVRDMARRLRDAKP